jgi:predicted transcriptional regulator YdeE
MKPEIISRSAFMVMGIVNRVTPADEDATTYERIWRRFEAYHEQIKSHSTDQAYYGVSFATGIEGVFDHVAGMAVGKVGAVPEGLVVREVPAARYALFESPVQRIGETYRHIFSQWLPKATYETSTSSPSFERYPPIGEEEAPVLIHIPICEVEK